MRTHSLRCSNNRIIPEMVFVIPDSDGNVEVFLKPSFELPGIFIRQNHTKVFLLLVCISKQLTSRKVYIVKHKLKYFQCMF